MQYTINNAWGRAIRTLCESGKICHEIPQKKSYKLCPDFILMESDSALLELTQRHFTYYAPATIKDAAYFFASRQIQIRELIDKLPINSIDCNDKEYFLLNNQLYIAILIPNA